MTKRLLIVDDSRVSRLVIQAKIASLRLGWEVREAASGEQALALARQWQPDCVTMDINMPGLNGFDAAERLRALLPQVQVVMLSANIQDSSRQRAQALGLHFVPKPITEATIEQTVAHFQGAACT